MADLKAQFKQLIQTRFAPVMQHFMENDYKCHQFDLDRFMAGFNERFDNHFSPTVQTDDVLRNKLLEDVIKLFENCTLETESVPYKENTEHFHELRLMYKGKMVERTYCYDSEINSYSDESISFLLGNRLYNLVTNTVAASYYNVSEILETLQIK